MNPNDPYTEKVIKEFEKEFGTFEEYKKNVNADVVPTIESLKLRDARLLLYLKLQKFIKSAILIQREEIKKRIRYYVLIVKSK